MSDATPTSPQTPIPRGAKTSLLPGANGSSGKWETYQLAIKLGCVTVLVVSIVAFFCLSGKSITIEQIGLLILGGASLAGITVASHKRGGGGGTGTTTLLGGMLLMLTAIGCSGCGGAIIPDPRPTDGVEPCEVEAAVVDGLATAVDDVDAVLPDDSPKATDGITYARGIVEEGHAAVEVCRALVAEGRSGLSAIIPWLSAASHVVRGIIAILGAAGVSIPDSIQSVLHSLGLAQAEVGVPPIERVAPYGTAKAWP